MTTARVICRVHGVVLGHVEERDGVLVFVRHGETNDLDAWPLDAALSARFVRCSRCRRTRPITGRQLLDAARASGRGARVLV